MGQLNIPHAPVVPSAPVPPPPPTEKPTSLNTKPISQSEKSDQFSVLEKIRLFAIIIVAISIPVLSTYYFTSSFYKTQFSNYQRNSEKQLAEIQLKIDNLNNPAVKQLQQLQDAIKDRLAQYNKEKQQLLENPLYIETNKKIEKLDKQIIKCTVHINNIENSKTNNYKDIDKLIDSIKKEIN